MNQDRCVLQTYSWIENKATQIMAAAVSAEEAPGAAAVTGGGAGEALAEERCGSVR